MRLPGLSKGHWLLFALALLIALVASLPLRLAVGWAASDTRGLGARGVHGSIWGGTIEQMRVGALPMGTIDAAMSPLPLLLGRVRLGQIGRAACRERVCQAVYISVVAVPSKKKNK